MKNLIKVLSFLLITFVIQYNLHSQQKAPDFNLPDIKGSGIHSLSELKGKIVLLIVWTSWCSVCRKQLPEMINLKRDFDAKGFEIVAVSIDETITEASRYIQHLEMKYDKLNFLVLYDRDKKFTKDYLTSGIPNNFIIGRDQSILKVIRGGFGPSNIDSLREMLINIFEKSPNKSNVYIKSNDLEKIISSQKSASKKFKIERDKFFITGALIDKKFLEHTFAMISGKIYSCYETEKNKNFIIKGSVLIKFIVGEDGKVIDAVIEQTFLNNEKTEECIKLLIKKLTFPPPKGGQSTIRYMLEFE